MFSKLSEWKWRAKDALVLSPRHSNNVQVRVSFDVGIQDIKINLEKQTVTVIGFTTTICINDALQATGKKFKLVSIEASK